MTPTAQVSQQTLDSISTSAQVKTPLGTTVQFGPDRPDGVPEGNWIQTVRGRDWFLMLRLYSPLRPFFDKTWRQGEIEEVK